MVEERVPGKQGLKPNNEIEVDEPESVEERVPGKQGLKQGMARRGIPAPMGSKSEFQENKD